MMELTELKKIKEELLELEPEDGIDFEWLLEFVDKVTMMVEQKENPKFRLKVHYFKCNDCEEITLIEKTSLVNPLYACPNCMEPMELMDDITVVQE